MAKQALGKGLGALIGKVDKGAKGGSPVAPVVADPAPGDVVLPVPLAKVIPSPLQPRKHFTDGALDELVESIREHGVIQPLIVRQVGKQLELIAGERRLRACQKLELETVPVIVREASDQDVLEMALIENLQREDLNPIEEAEAYKRLAEEFGMTQERIAIRVGKNRATVANAMRLLELCPDARDHLIAGRLSIGHAKALLGVKAKRDQSLLAEQVVKKSLTVRATEKLVSEHLNPGAAGRSTSTKKGGSGELSSAVAEVQQRLRDRLSTRVHVSHGKDKGKIEIEYFGNDDLERLLELMGVD